MVQSESLGEMLGNYCSPTVGIGLLIAVGLLLALFALFVLHTLTLWASADPEAAFHRARSWAGVTSSIWNSMRTLWNGGKKFAFFWVPQYNHLAKHFMEPAIYISLDVVSQVFLHHHYYGIIRDVDNREAGSVPFRVSSTCANCCPARSHPFARPTGSLLWRPGTPRRRHDQRLRGAHGSD